MENRDRFALVTGAASGFGAALARRFAEEGWALILSDADDEGGLELVADGLRADHDVPILTIPLDLARRDQAEEIMRYLESVQVSPDLLALVPSSAAKFEDVLWRNVISLTTLARLVLPGMSSRRKGWILSAAVLSPQVFPNGSNMDFAVKNYLMALSRALTAEFAGRGIKITLASDQPVSFLRPKGPAHFDPEEAAGEAYEGSMKGEQFILLRGRTGPIRTGPRSRRLVVPAESPRHPSFREVVGGKEKKKTPAPAGKARARKSQPARIIK